MACIIAIGGMAVEGMNKKKSILLDANEKTLATTGDTIWKEVPIEKGRYQAAAAYAQYDLKNQMQESDYVFRGTVTDCKDYKIEWTDEEGNLWGPYFKSVLEVKISEEYCGESPVSGDSVRVYYPYSLSTDFDASVSLEKKKEYVFITCALDDEFVETRTKESPDDKFEQENYADVYITSPVYDVLPIEKDNVLMYHEMFYWDEEVMQEAITGEAIKTVDADTITTPECLESGWFIALNKEDFEKAFTDMLQIIDYLPDSEKMKEKHDGIIPKYSEEKKEEHKRNAQYGYWGSKTNKENGYEK